MPGGTLLLCAALSNPAAQDVPLDILLARAASYVADFIGTFSNVVSEEEYVQETTVKTNTQRGAAALARRRRILKSDFLLVRQLDGHGWQPFRDVYEADGTRVREREQRLERLFLRASADAIEQAQTIAEESARFNLGPLVRTFNNPVLALAFLQADTQRRFRFQRRALDSVAGVKVWIVSFEEQNRPTIIKGSESRDVPAEGRVWIAADTGTILKTEVIVRDTLALIRLSTTFEPSDRFRIAVPVEMHDEYSLAGATISGRAKYGEFRQFGITTQEQFSSSPR